MPNNTSYRKLYFTDFVQNYLHCHMEMIIFDFHGLLVAKNTLALNIKFIPLCVFWILVLKNDGFFKNFINPIYPSTKKVANVSYNFVKYIFA